TLMDSEIIGNRAKGDGGGALLTEGATLTTSSCTFASNHADGPGGGLALLDAAAASLTNVTISGNSARFGGRILHKSTGLSTLVNATIAFNSAVLNGGGAFSSSSRGSLTFTNTIVARNTGGGPFPEVDNDDNPADMVDFANNFIGDSDGAGGSF